MYDICQQNAVLQKAIKVSPYGFSMVKLANKNQPSTIENRHQLDANLLVKQLAEQYDIVLVDASVNDEGLLALPILNESEIIIQLSRKPDSIKQAYAPVSYTHLDVYKRQGLHRAGLHAHVADDEFVHCHHCHTVQNVP